MKTKAKKSIKRHYLYCFFTVTLLSVLLIDLIVFLLTSKMQIDTTQAYTTSQLEQVSKMTDLLFTQVHSLSTQVIQSSDTNRCLSRTDFNRIQEARAGIKLREIQSSCPYLRYISFYNAASNRLISSSTSDFLTQEDIESYYNMLRENPDNCVLRKVGKNYVTQAYKSAHVYTFVFSVNLRNDGISDLIILDVNEQYFSSIIENTFNPDSSFQQVLLMNRNGVVFSSNTLQNGEMHFAAAETDFDVTTLPELQGTSGSATIHTANGQLALLTYAKAPLSGMTIVSISPYSDVLRDIPYLGLMILLAGLAILLIGALVSYRMSAKLAAPIEALYNSYVKNPSSENELDQLNQEMMRITTHANKLEQGLIASYSETKKRYMQQLLHGECRFDDAFFEQLHKFNIDTEADWYGIIIMHSESREENSRRERISDFVLTYAMENIAEEVLAPFGAYSSYRNSRDDLVFLLSLSASQYPDNLFPELQRVNQTMDREFSIEVTICIGNIVMGCNEINMGYESTCIAMERSPIQNHGKAFFAADVSKQVNASQYHNKLHLKLAEHIRNEDLEACSAEFDLALSYMNNVNFSTAVIYFFHVFMLLLDDFSSSLADSSAQQSLILKLNEINQNQPNVYTLRIRCMEFLSMLIQTLRDNRSQGTNLVAKRAMEYIQKNYDNPDLSLGMVADLTGLSHAYFGKVFTAQTGISFNDYLINTRMKKACQLLTDTKLPIRQISEQIGLLNTNYFYSVFKKKYGTTPLSYRRNQGKNDDANANDSSES